MAFKHFPPLQEFRNALKGNAVGRVEAVGAGEGSSLSPVIVTSRRNRLPRKKVRQKWIMLYPVSRDKSREKATQHVERKGEKINGLSLTWRDWQQASWRIGERKVRRSWRDFRRIYECLKSFGNERSVGVRETKVGKYSMVMRKMKVRGKDWGAKLKVRGLEQLMVAGLLQMM